MIVVTVILGIFAGGIIVFGLRGAQTRTAVNRTLPALITFAVLGFMTAFYAFGQYLNALLPVELEPITTSAEYEARQPLPVGEMALFVGEMAGFTPVRTAATFGLVLDDGATLTITGTTYNDLLWDVTENESRFLPEGAGVVVQARALENDRLLAYTVFQGTHDEFRDYMPRYATMPLVTAISSLILAVICVVLPFYKRRKLPA
ncbi:MAG: hypothetical protein EA396_07760 [Anaerolineaceae bacterium]|nr:MAG: hypothetical protein EA396_07760 [Anaerolineaceae bacterium]